tara:strand:- start:888 stop:1277 length:390 start_codon:yes stop_codon:yes gene_type:complete
MIKKISSVLLLLVFSLVCKSQERISIKNKNLNTNNTGPKLVVGIVADQMRYDNLTRFSSKYGDGGFKRMMNEGFNYDRHVPLLFFGNGIKHGQTFQKTKITDIAPTISALLGVSFPNATIGQPLEFVLD